MKRTILGILAVLMIFMELEAVAQEPARSKPKGPDEQAMASEKVIARKPQLSQEREKQLADLRRKVTSAQCPGSFPVPIAVSVWGFNHHTAGQDVLLTYPNTITNEGGAWGNNSTFVAPCNGLYFFNIQFVKDPYYNNGTTDDVYISLYKNGTWVGQAWAGETDTRGRGTGAYSVVLRLKQSDWLQTIVHSDGDLMRNIGYYNFTGHRIGN